MSPVTNVIIYMVRNILLKSECTIAQFPRLPVSDVLTMILTAPIVRCKTLNSIVRAA